jgi:hypothetical protein
MESILDSIKAQLGIEKEYRHFDAQIITHINSVFMTLNQLGVGPDSPYYIEDELSTWYEFLNGRMDLNAVKTYMGLCVRLLFDPPTTSFVLDATQRAISELEWRLAAQANRSP